MRRAVPAVVLALAILAMSGPWGAASRTGSVAEPWLAWLGLSPAAAALVHAALRKTGHALAYALFGVLAFRGLADPSRPPRRSAGIAWALGILLAAADEALQALSPARGGSFRDVLLDSAGAAVGVLYRVRKVLRGFRDAPALASSRALEVGPRAP